MIMDNKKDITPEVGRGCAFGYDEMGEPMAQMADGCFKLHETPWMAQYPDHQQSDIFEVRFKNTRRSFYQNVNNLDLQIGDIVAVEASPGHDIGIISLTGDMVAKQMRRIGFNPYNGEFKKIYRKAKPYDIERWQEAIALEHETMIRSRQIAAEMGLDMKIGDVEYQGDKIKAIFYYIADGRVDFRELIKVFAEQFHIRIEMKQIGARQEAGRIGGIGACGRELCCASWISSFSSVTTGAARVQDLSLNPLKLAGQCSKLKCCLMYEYDLYMDARKSIPRLREPLQALDGEYFLVKTDILAKKMTFSSSKESMSNLVTIPVWRVKEILAANRNGEKVESIAGDSAPKKAEEPTYRTEEDSITRFDKSKKRKKKRNNKPQQGGERQQEVKSEAQEHSAEGTEPQEQRSERRHPNRNHNHNHNNRNRHRRNNQGGQTGEKAGGNE
jgi:cell fate regulator YaaT (PSP1 superfamily)